MGAGAVGGYFGARLLQGGHDVLFVARGANLAALRERGLRLDRAGETATLRVRAAERPDPADLVLFAVKSYDTDAAALLLPPASRVLSLQNGLGNVERLRARFRDVIAGVAYVSAELVEPGRIVWTAGGRIIVDPFGADLRAPFEACGIGCEVSEDIDRDVWEKLVGNAVCNTIATAWECELGELPEPPRRATVDSAFDEIYAVARALGIGIRPSARERSLKFCRDHPRFKTSTQQDAARGKPLEAEAHPGEIVRRARVAGVTVPTLEEIYRRLSARR